VFSSLIHYSYYRGAAGALLVYDVTNKASFEHAQTVWLTELRLAPQDVVITLVGNKADSSLADREVPAETAKAFADTNSLSFVETSALDSINVQAAFQHTLSGFPFTTDPIATTASYY